MSKHIDQGKLQAMAEELAKDLHSEDDIAELTRALTKLTIETALKAEQETTATDRPTRPSKVTPMK